MGLTATLRIQPLGLELPVGAGQTLLQAAIAARVTLPSVCRNGTCRACIALTLEGRVRHCIEWPGLSSDEKAEGWILPCVALAEGDVVILQPQAVAAAAVGGLQKADPPVPAPGPARPNASELPDCGGAGLRVSG